MIGRNNQEQFGQLIVEPKQQLGAKRKQHLLSWAIGGTKPVPN
jgi:hypothetical protein